MKRNDISESDVIIIANRLEQLSPHIPGFGSVDPAWSRPPAVLVIDCVLSLNRNYDTFLVPRLKTFMNNHPKTRRLTDLAKLMVSYPTPHAFVQQELSYNHETRANTLQAVVKFVCQIVEDTQTIEEEKKVLRQWALLAEPSDYQTLNIKGFGIAGFQYLRMLFGADTTKPDVHIIGFLSELLNRRVSAVEALRLLEAASESVGLSVRDVDTYIWQIRARGEQNVAGANVVRQMKTQTFTASIWRENNWFIAQCLEVDIASQGQSEEEALINLAEALELYFEPPQPSFKPVIRKFEAKIGAA